MGEIRRIVLATDFSECSMPAVDYAVAMAQKFGAELHLVHIFEQPFFSHTGVSETVRPELDRWIRDLREEARDRLKKMVSDIAKEKVKAEIVLCDGNPYQEIGKVAADLPADLIVMGTHGRTGITHLLMGSVAERVVRHAPCAVLTVRSPKARAGKTGKGKVEEKGYW